MEESGTKPHIPFGFKHFALFSPKPSVCERVFLYLRSLLTPMPLKPAGEGGHIHKGVYWTLWFWLFENFATSNCSSKTKQRWMPLGCIIYYLDRFDAKERRWSVKGRLYIHIGVGLSTLLVSTNRAMRRPSNSGTGDRTGSTFCVYRGI